MESDYDYFTSQELFGNNSLPMASRPSSQRSRTRTNLLNLPPMQPIVFDDDPHLKTIQVLDEEEEQQQQPEQTAGDPPTAAQLQPAVLPDEVHQKAATLTSSLPASSDGSSSAAAGGGGGKKETLQSELRNMGISLNLMLGTSMSKRRQPLPLAGGTDLEAEKQFFLEQYVKAGTLVDRANSHLNKLTRAMEETKRVVGGLQIDIIPKVMQCSQKLLTDWQATTRACENSLNTLLTNHLKRVSDVNQEKIHDLIDRLLKAIKHCFPNKEDQQKKLSEILRIAYNKREEIFLASSNNATNNRSSKRKSDNDAEAPKSSNKRRKTDNN